ncbi:ketopantoate reductase [Halovenus aranensis]|uniref:2-dehydropantoate 2-reductase n=1 Tax=Halovenus aranensis TaxID=890420 RepID=A0A1G8XGK1_9EURY|nr:ketopantoate reductase family protein [Halovenus aranensis]SDJ89566.1 ketopantoate reductase [Halovenus aranensis]
MDICVFGAGSLGSLIGGLLADTHEVTLVGRDPHVGVVDTKGLCLSGAVDRHVSPTGRTAVPQAADLGVVTVKSFDTSVAARELATADLDAVLSLQNGMGNEAALATRLDSPVLAGTCTYGARLRDPGHVECSGLGEVVLGAREGGESALADRVGTAFDDGGLATTVSTEMPRRLWEKLTVNAGINAATALARVPNGALTDDPGASVTRRAAREAARVARTQGVSVDADEAAKQAVAVADATARNRSSMLQDIEAGRRTEIAAINGYVVEHASQPVPVNETLTALVRTWEAEHGHLES